ncbi:hypothetical protein LPB136_07925 [Tenacibaculum todarodis]|uniref:Peptidase M56 domain-containing protein n=2 Tax=Tenacibaculum todarodis TaxID=1850252 RepID=A0A1L3JJG0_9FLAO|nr:hypothetical protein LPB136_07925 [Tenacibaculum todarodis]
MHKFNRFYLLGSILFAFFAPAFIIYVEAIPALTAIPETTQEFTTLEFPISENIVEESINWTTILTSLYILISAVFGIRFIRNLYKIISKVKQNTHVNLKSATLVLVETKILPHSFWNYIFINKNEYNNGAIEDELFTHELTHVTQKHTFDVILIELLQIVFWINPMFILLKKAIQLNHEFLADEKVINQHKNTFQYQHLLLNKAAWNNEYYLASNLNYSLTKKRLKMMTTKSSQVKILLKKLAVIPLLAGFLFLFAERVEAQEIIEIVEERIPPPPPMSPLQYVKKQKNKDTSYFYNEKEINYSEAIELIKKVKDINIESKEINSKTIINLSKEPIIIYEQEPKKRKSSKQSISPNPVLEDIKLKLEDVNALKMRLTQKDTIKKPITIKYEKLSASKAELEEYNSIIERGKKDRLFKNKDIIKLQYLYSSMSKEQKNSVEDYQYIIPPPPPPIKVKKGEKSNIPTPPPAPKVKKGEESNIPPPPPPVKTKNGIEKGWSYTNNQTLYYVKEKGETKYFNRWGKEVDEKGKELTSKQKSKSKWVVDPKVNIIEEKQIKEKPKNNNYLLNHSKQIKDHYYLEDKKISKKEYFKLIKNDKDYLISSRYANKEKSISNWYLTKSQDKMFELLTKNY